MTPEAPSAFLIRHGQTDWSVAGRHTGRTDRPLTSEGAAEAVAIRLRLAGIEFARVLSSPLLRARQTCERVGLSPTAEFTPDLSEWDYGEFEGLTTEEIRRTRPGWDLFRDGCPGGEIPAQVAARADRIVARLRASEGRSAVFSHAHFLCVLAVRWIGLDVDEARHLRLATASLSILGFGPHGDQTPVITLWNEACRGPAPLRTHGP
jgi:broad specificity phosphatase PhoE